MAAKTENRINLLPSDLLKSGTYANFVEILKNLSIVGAVILVLGIFAAGSAMIINANRLRILTNEKNNLLAALDTLNAEEQRHFIVKDKAGKILEAELANKGVRDEFANANVLISSYPLGADLSSLEVDAKGLTTVSSSPNSTILKQLMNQFLLNNIYAKVVLNSLSLNPTTGYQLEVSAVSNPL